MDIDFRNFEFLCGLEKCKEVVDMGMNTTVRDLQDRS